MGVIDIHTLNSVKDCVEMIKLMRLMAERGYTFSDFVPSLDGDTFQEKYDILESLDSSVFPNSECYLVNDADFEFKHLFEDVADYFDPEEMSVFGDFFLGDNFYKMYEMCKEKNISVSDTNLCFYVDGFNNCIQDYGDGSTYMELFIPTDKIIEETKCVLMLFYTEPSLITYEAMVCLFDAFDYIDGVVKGEIELEGRKK